jgi:hypothetical protein
MPIFTKTFQSSPLHQELPKTWKLNPDDWDRPYFAEELKGAAIGSGLHF